MRELTQRQQSIIVGTILGDGYLQPTSKNSARLRIEQSAKQKWYVWWKYRELKSLMQSAPIALTRYNPVYRRTYSYARCQTYAHSKLGELRRLFYTSRGSKRVPEGAERMLTPLALATWYMDDGYLFHGDRVAYIYLSDLSRESIAHLKRTLARRYDLHPRLYRKKLGDCFYFPVVETRKLLRVVRRYILPRFRYKVLREDPRTTEVERLR